MKILSFTPSEHIFPDTVKGQNAVVETRLRITGGSTLLSPGVIDPGVPYGFVLKSVTGGPHVTSGHVWLNGKWFVHTDKSINQIKDSAFYYLGTASGGTLAAEFKPVALSITSPGSEISPGDVLNILFDYSAVWDIDVLYSINGGTPISHATGVSATGSYMFDTAGITFSHGDILTVILKDTDSSLNDTVSFDLMVATITIDSINNGLPLTYEGLFEDGMYYFADTTGTKVVDQNDPDRSEWFIGTGNADGDIDLDIKMLAITDVVVPETVQLGVAFDVSGNYVMLEDKIVIEGYNDDSSTWVKLHVGDYIDVTGGSFTETVTIESADGFTVNSSVTVRVRSYDGYALNGSDSTDVIATVTMNAISGVVDGTPYTLEGGTDGDAVEIWVDDGTGYAYEGDAVVVGSAWTYDITLAVGTYGIKAIDGTDSRGYAEQTGVVVESGDKYMVYSFSGSVLYADEYNGTALTNKSSIDLTTAINYISKYKTNNTDYIYALDNDGYIALIKYSSGTLSKIGEIALSGSNRVYGYHVSGTRLFVSRYDSNQLAQHAVDYSLSVNAIGIGGQGVSQVSPYGVIFSDDVTKVALFTSDRIHKNITYNPANNTLTRGATTVAIFGDMYYNIQQGNQISGNIVFARLGKVQSYDFTDQTLGTALDITTTLDYYSVPVSSDTVLVCDRTNGYIYKVSFNAETKTLSKDTGYNTGLTLRTVDYSVDLAVICSSTHLRFIKSDYSDPVNIEVARTRAVISKIEE